MHLSDKIQRYISGILLIHTILKLCSTTECVNSHFSLSMDCHILVHFRHNYFYFYDLFL